MIGRTVAKKSKQCILLLRFFTAFLQQFSDEMGQKDAASGHRQIIQIEDNFGFPKIQKDKLRPYQKVKQQISAHKLRVQNRVKEVESCEWAILKQNEIFSILRI